MTHNYFYLKEYLPVRYNATPAQEQDRQTCYLFKDGYTDTESESFFLEKAKDITGKSTKDWIICFIPASTADKTFKRYILLEASFENKGYTVKTDAIFNLHDREAEHISGKTNNPIKEFGFNEKCFAGKKVILIDDIITRGTTFNMVADKLEALGAVSVTGLFLAKTINPDYQPSFCTQNEEYYDTDYYEEEEATYERYGGSYAQDVEGWSDQDIEDVFDGEPDAYWNID